MMEEEDDNDIPMTDWERLHQVYVDCRYCRQLEKMSPEEKAALVLISAKKHKSWMFECCGTSEDLTSTVRDIYDIDRNIFSKEEHLFRIQHNLARTAAAVGILKQQKPEFGEKAQSLVDDTLTQSAQQCLILSEMIQTIRDAVRVTSDIAGNMYKIQNSFNWTFQISKAFTDINMLKYFRFDKEMLHLKHLIVILKTSFLDIDSYRTIMEDRDQKLVPFCSYCHKMKKTAGDQMKLRLISPQEHKQLSMDISEMSALLIKFTKAEVFYGIVEDVKLFEEMANNFHSVSEMMFLLSMVESDNDDVVESFYDLTLKLEKTWMNYSTFVTQCIGLLRKIWTIAQMVSHMNCTMMDASLKNQPFLAMHEHCFPDLQEHIDAFETCGITIKGHIEELSSKKSDE